MKKISILLFCTAMRLFQPALFADTEETFPTILFTPMKELGGDISSKAVIYSEEFRIALLNAGRFRLIELENGSNEGITIKNRLLTYNESTGREASLFLISKVSHTEETLRFQIELYDLRGEPTLSKSMDSSVDTYKEDLNTLAEEVSLVSCFSGKNASVWIQTYIDTKQWDRAYLAWSKQVEIQGEENLTEAFFIQGDKIREKYAALKRISSERLLKGGYYEQARYHAEEALKIQPDNEINRELLEKIEKLHSEYQEMILLSQISLINDLIDNKEDTGALTLCDKLIKDRESDSRLREIREKILELQEERHYWENARVSYRKGNYNQASKEIAEALSFDPDYLEYTILQERIIRQLTVQEKTNATVNDYRDRLAAVDYKNALLIHRENPQLIHLSVGKRDIESLMSSDEYVEYDEKIWIASADYIYFFQKLPPYLTLNHPALSLQPYVSGQLIFGRNYNGEFIDGTVTGYSEEKILLGEIRASAGTRFQLLSFCLGTGFSFGIGGMSLSSSTDYPSDSTSNVSDNDHSFFLSTSWELLFGWRPGDRTEILLRYNRGIYPVFNENMMKDVKWHDLTLGIGFQMW